MLNRSLILLPLLAAAVATALAGCKPENKFQPPPPPEISVAKPLQQQVTPYEVLTGNTVAFNTVDLVARVEGFLTSINYTDGSLREEGRPALRDRADHVPGQGQGGRRPSSIRPRPSSLNAEAEFTRQETLLRQNVTAQNTYDQAKAKRDSARANVENQEGNLVIAQTNLGYTSVTAPFDGVVTKHLISVGELVGNGVATKLATIVQLNPIYVEFNMSEQDVLQDPRQSRSHRLTVEELSQDPARYRPDERGRLPHQGFLNYVSPEIDANDRHDPGARPVQQSQPRPAAGLLRPHQGADGTRRQAGRSSFPTASSPRTRPASTCWSSTRTMSSSSAASRRASCWSAACA